jgi:N-ethylmaleimide reductase
VAVVKPDLFAPIRVGPYDLRHRVCMAPLTRCRAGPGDVPTALMAEHYAQRADPVRGAAIIVAEATQISLEGRGYPHTPGIHTPEQVRGWQAVTDAVHAKGGRIFLQLWHVGRISHPDFQPGGGLPVAPSPVKPPGLKRVYEGRKPYVTPRALEAREIPRIIDDYRRAAACALDAGFDGVEVHGANGYLLDQFLRDGTNLRTDEWGGSVANRCRLHVEVTAAVCEVWGPSRVGVRLSPSGGAGDRHDSDPRATFSAVVERLAGFGLAYLHLLRSLEGDAESGAGVVPVEIFRPLFPGPIMVNGRYDLDQARSVIRDGHADLVSFGRLFIANPDLPERLRRRAPLNTPDEATFYSPGPKGYTDYPALAD